MTEQAGEFSIEIRAATAHELRKAEAEDHANLTDGAAAILVNGELVGIGNEYGTVKLVAGTDHTPTQDQCEEFVQAAMTFYEGALP